METYHFQPSPVVHGPNPHHDPLSPLYVIVALPNQFQSKARAYDLVMLEYHIDRVSLTVSELWPFEIWHAPVPRPSYRQTLYTSAC